MFSLALAFVPSVTLFALMDRVLLTPLPIRAPSEVVEILFKDASPDAVRPFRAISYPDVKDVQTELKSFAGIAFSRRQGVSALVNGRRQSMWASLVNDDFFMTLGLPGQIAGNFPTDRQSIVISHNLWQREFDGRPDILGQTLLLNGAVFTVGGIADQEFRGMERQIATDLWIPIETFLKILPRNRNHIERREARDGVLWARLRPGIQPTEAWAEVESFGRKLAQRWPATNRNLVAYTFDPLADRARGGIVTAAIGVLLLGILLAVASANVAGILLARAEEGRHETAVRQSLGASRYRLVRASLVESSVLATAAAALGLAGAGVLTDLLPALLPPVPVPLNLSFSFGPRVWIYAGSMIIVAALSFGLIPAWRGSRPDLLSGLRHDSAVSVFTVRVPIRSFLVVAQVAAAEVLLFVAGLSLDTLWRLRNLDPGLDPSRPAALALVLPTTESGAMHGMDRESIAASLAKIAGVRRVAYGSSVPLSGIMGPAVRMDVPGREPREVLGGSVGPEFFSTLGVRIVAGRDLSRFDERSVLVNLTLARLIDPAGSAVGRQVHVDRQLMTIAGIFADSGWSSVGEALQPRVIALASSRAGGETTFAVEVAGDPQSYLAQIRDVIAAAQPGTTVLSSKTLRQHYEGAMYFERTATKAFYGLGLIALLLTAIGLHGVAAALFARRSREFAIRLALGASPREMVRAALSDGMILAIIGIAVGLTVALPLAHILGSKVHGFSPWSVAALGFSSAIVLGAAAVAAGHPASRVLRIQPGDALRAE